MKIETGKKSERVYRQKARAQASAATGRRILESFLKRLETGWFEDITLDMVAADAGVTVQTILRRFGSKAGLLEAAHHHLGETITVRRTVNPGDVERTVEVLTDDYESIGDLVLHLLAQEERHPDLKPILERGRAGHREWLAEVFVGQLGRLHADRRSDALDALVVATDIHIWKILRREMGRSISAFRTMVNRMLRDALRDFQSVSGNPASVNPPQIPQ
jgi:AcrR family transcriptional regulator